MKYIILTWLTDWKDEELISKDIYAYRDAYIIADENGKPKLFDIDYDGLVFAIYFKIVDFHNYMVGNR